MKTFAFVTMALFAVSALPLAAAEEEYTGLCTFPTVPVGTCASAGLSSTTFWYSEPTVGGTYSYQCDPFKLVCVLAPDTTWTYSSVTVPWVSVVVTPWCTICAAIATDGDLVPPFVLS